MPVGGRLRFFVQRWKAITSDPSILDIVQGMHIELTDLPVQRKEPQPFPLSEEELLAGDLHIQSLLEKRAIVPAPVDVPGQFFSTVFTIPKRDSGWRMILNLRRFNSWVSFLSFKMDTLVFILSYVTRDCFMSIFDFTDAYLTVPISGSHVKFLKFRWRGQVFMYVVLPFGISSAPRKFTKLLKPILSFLRRQGIIVLTYIDDGFTVAPSFDECYRNICYVMRTFTHFGFLINVKKSQPVPSKQVRSLGFIINSSTMLVTLPSDKIENALSLCRQALVENTFSIHFLAQVIGTLISLFPACPLGRLHYRTLERLKVAALKRSRGSFSGLCSLNQACIDDLLWWIDVVPTTACPIDRGKPSDVICTDSSGYAWSGFFWETCAQGFYTVDEMSNIIAYKELLAIYYSLRSFSRFVSGSWILFRSDNVGAVAYLRDMGGMANQDMDSLAKEIWRYAISKGLWISASYIRGSDNVAADLGSRILSIPTEWSLPVPVFLRIEKLFFKPTIDLFASRLNAKCDRYISWIPDPYCLDVDSFTVSWSGEKPFLFPPFSCLFRSLQKIQNDAVEEAILVFPLWSTQHWFPRVLQMLISPMFLLPHRPALFLPWQTTPTLHPLDSSLLMMVAKISSSHRKQLIFRQTLKKSSTMQSVPVQDRLTRESIRNGYCLQTQDHLIPICLL